MWPFKKKKKIETPTQKVPSKYHVGQQVGILQNDFSSLPGVVYAIYASPNGEVLLDVQVGGECPYIKKRLREDQIKPKY